MVVGEMTQRTDLLVIGAGPGGYAAAFRAADLGLDVTIVDKRANLGGVCLHEGCIPSKTLLYLTELIHEAKRAEEMGVLFGKPQLDLTALRAWKNKVVESIGQGLSGLSDKRDIQWLSARAYFEKPNQVRLIGSDVAHIKFRHAIVATGSVVQTLPGIDYEKHGDRIMDSTAALELRDIPENLLIIGGGYIALELGQVYHALGSKVTMAVRSTILREVDRDLVRLLAAQMEDLCEAIHLHTTVSSLKEDGDGVEVVLRNEDGKTTPHKFDRVLVAVGRRPLIA